MDMYQFDSSNQNENQHHESSNGCKTGAQTLSTDNDNNINGNIKKSKIIKKNYQPIHDGNIYIRYQDDPIQYKRLRKKIQNRESAARVRGRKKGTMQGLEIQVQDLKKINSQLMLRNATLQTQNRSLKNQVQFLRGIVKPSSLNSSQNIDKYLNLQPTKPSNQSSANSSTHSTNSSMKAQHTYQSPFQDQDSAMSWVRSSYSSGSRSNWSTLFILTIVVCIFVLPSSDSANGAIIAQQTSTSYIDNGNYGTFGNLLQNLFGYGKIVIKYVIILGYIMFMGSFVYGKYWKKKLKKF